MTPRSNDDADDDERGRSGTHEKLGAHGARLASLEAELVAMREEMNARLNAQDTTLNEIKEMIAMAKGGIAVLARIGAWAVGIAAIIHSIPDLIALVKNAAKP